jgi:2,4-dienoyl-CoA reductase-like NADH-dependent reductase (Old Yellow Enzyme family)
MIVMNALFSPFRIRGLTLKNRVVVSPMCQYSAEDGMANDYHLVHLGRFALGGFGTVMVEATAVTPEGRISHGDMGIWSDAHVEPLARIAHFAKAQGAAPGIQLAHAGRKGSARRPWRGAGTVVEADAVELGDEPWVTVAPSALAHAENFAAPAELDREGIARIRAAFGDAARRAGAAGFDIIELHCAHGYLLNQFLSPVANKRTDRYGGSRDNRMRLPLEIAGDLRAIWPADKPVFVRVSATDAIEGGWTIEDTVAFALELKRIGIDLIDCSSGGFAGAAFNPKPHYQVPHAEAVRHGADIPTMAVGVIFDPEGAEQVIADGKADLIALAREALNDPNWPLHAMKKLATAGDPYTAWPKQSGYAVRALSNVLETAG